MVDGLHCCNKEKTTLKYVQFGSKKVLVAYILSYPHYFYYYYLCGGVGELLSVLLHTTR
jgi:hypothetical protein